MSCKSYLEISCPPPEMYLIKGVGVGGNVKTQTQYRHSCSSSHFKIYPGHQNKTLLTANIISVFSCNTFNLGATI